MRVHDDLQFEVRSKGGFAMTCDLVVSGKIYFLIYVAQRPSKLHIDRLIYDKQMSKPIN